MRILAIDVGKGTQDILLYNTDDLLENSIKLVLPSPHLFISQQIAEIDNDIYFDGEIMGGGKLKHSILDHIAKGYDVVMESKCARTIRDDLEEVKSLGINIADVNIDYTGYTRITLSDINITKLSKLLLEYDLDVDFDIIAIAVQDHGYDENMTDRDFRFEKIREKLIEPTEPYKFGFLSHVPDYYSRMKSIECSIKKEGITLKPILMDTKFASICGMCNDDIVNDLDSYIVVDIGNGHTMAASIQNSKIQGLFEHHTRQLDSLKLKNYIDRLANGQITNDEIYNDHGHGAHVINPISQIEKVIVTGPKRHLIEKTGLNYHYACPGGDVMMTGTIGLIKTVEYMIKC